MEELFGINHGRRVCRDGGRGSGGGGGGREGELEESVVAAVGEHQGGPFHELGVERVEVGLAGEEGGEEVLAGKGEGCWGRRGGQGGRHLRRERR